MRAVIHSHEYYTPARRFCQGGLIMIGKNTPNVLISPEEAAALARKAGTADDIMRGLSVYDAYIRFADIEEYAAKDFLIYSAFDI